MVTDMSTFGTGLTSLAARGSARRLASPASTPLGSGDAQVMLHGIGCVPGLKMKGIERAGVPRQACVEWVAAGPVGRAL